MLSSPAINVASLALLGHSDRDGAFAFRGGCRGRRRWRRLRPIRGYLQHLRLAEHHRAERGKNADRPAGTAARAEPAGGAPGDHRTAVRQPRPTRPLPALPQALPAAICPQSAHVMLSGSSGMS